MSRRSRADPSRLLKNVMNGPRRKNRERWNILHDEYVIDCDYIDVVDALLLELVVCFDISGDLCTTCARERSGHSYLSNGSKCEYGRRGGGGLLYAHKDVLSCEALECEALIWTVFLDGDGGRDDSAWLDLCSAEKRCSSGVGGLSGSF